MEENIEDKIKELAKKHGVPEKLFIEALQEEEKKVVLKNRRFSKKLQELIEKYADHED